MIRLTLSNQLNPIKDYQAKLAAFLDHQAEVTGDLKLGWNPVTIKDEQTKPIEQYTLALRLIYL